MELRKGAACCALAVCREMAQTIAEMLAWATEELRSASTTPRLDAELLLAHVLGWSRARVIAHAAEAASPPQHAAYRQMVERRQNLEPVAYLVGHREFYGLAFLVTPAVLVPRPETELLVDVALALARSRATDHRPSTIDENPTPVNIRSAIVSHRSSVIIADIGTGSGCIAVALATHLPGATVYAIDVSPEALAVAARNVARHGVGQRVRLLEGDLLSPLPEAVDLLVSNPPYTVLEGIDEGVRRHEPHLALDGGPDGLAAYRRLLAEAPRRLRPGGVVLLEIGAAQGESVAGLARAAFPEASMMVHQDLAGLDRVVEIRDVG